MGRVGRLLPRTLSERTGPVFGAGTVEELDGDLTRRHQGEPQGERIVVSGQVPDRDGRPVRHTLVEVLQANAAGRYVHVDDRHPAPLDPNFTGAGRCLTDAEGRYRFTTIKPGAYPWRNHPNAWRPAHIHFRRVRAAAAVLTESLVVEHERGIGGWQAEWGALSEALAYTGGAAAASFRTVVTLEVHPDRMRANLEAAGGLVMSERLSFLLAETLGRNEAHRVLSEAAATQLPLREALAGRLPPDGLDEALDPTTYVGSASAFVDRALDRYRQERG